ncbi:hypothetical protein [Campylobacter sp. TTU-622]|nr:hypothetical protein [Campylobacter sp. TTU-622]
MISYRSVSKIILLSECWAIENSTYSSSLSFIVYFPTIRLSFLYLNIE